MTQNDRPLKPHKMVDSQMTQNDRPLKDT